MATGIIAGSMSLGFAICPLMSGPAFNSDILKLEHRHGSFSHIFFLIAGLGFGAVELFIICMYIGPKAKTLFIKRKKDDGDKKAATGRGDVPKADNNKHSIDIEIQ